MERERQVARERGEEVAPTNRNQLREALGITNAEAAHLGLSDFSDAPDLREDPAAFAAAVATINRERREQAIAQYLVDRERYEQYLADKAAYEEARQGQGPSRSRNLSRRPMMALTCSIRESGNRDPRLRRNLSRRPTMALTCSIRESASTPRAGSVLYDCGERFSERD